MTRNLLFNYIRGKEQVRTSVGPLRNSTGRVVCDESEMAGLLNRYFPSMFTQEQSGELPKAKSIYLGGEEGLLQKIQVGVKAVKEQLGNIRGDQALGPDNMHPRVLRDVAEQVSELLTEIFNPSLESGQVPENWRVANVTPLFKKGSREELGNYRPVSLTSVVWKVLETLIKDQLRTHLNTYKLSNGSQHGFIKGSSCLANVLEFYEAVSDWVDEGKAVNIVYLDFKKAFDKVPHRRLIAKVRACGVAGQVANWIVNWLVDRKQRVAVSGGCLAGRM